jgi:hypothetical protein
LGVNVTVPSLLFTTTPPRCDAPPVVTTTEKASIAPSGSSSLATTLIVTEIGGSWALWPWTEAVSSLAIGATFGAGSSSEMVATALDGAPSVAPTGLLRLTPKVSSPS